MTPSETAKLVDAIQALAPAHQFADTTALLWAPLLADVPGSDAITAVQALVVRQPFIGVHDIITEVKRMRRERVERVGIPVPNVDPARSVEYLAEQRAVTAAVADGRMDEEARGVYERGTHTLTGAPPLRALPAAPEDQLPDRRHAIERALAGAFRLPPPPAVPRRARPAVTVPEEPAREAEPHTDAGEDEEQACPPHPLRYVADDLGRA